MSDTELDKKMMMLLACLAVVVAAAAAASHYSAGYIEARLDGGECLHLTQGVRYPGIL